LNDFIIAFDSPFLFDIFTELYKTWYFFPFSIGGASYSDSIFMGNGSGQIGVSTDNAFCINENSVKKDLAWELIKFLTKPESYGYNELMDVFGLKLPSPAGNHWRNFYNPMPIYTPGLTPFISNPFRYTQLVAYNWHVTGSNAQIDRTIIDFYSSLKDMDVYDNKMYLYPEIEQALRDVLFRFHTGDLSAEAAAAELQLRVSAALGRNR